MRRFAAGLLTIFVVGIPGSESPPPRAPLPRLRWPVAVIGHRAGAGVAPENTLGAIRQAIRLHVDYVEVDVRTNRDGALVIMHDPTVDRTTNGRGAVRALTLAEIRLLAAKNRFGSAFQNERVPTLAEVLALCRGKVHLYLDQKDADTTTTLKALKAHGMEKSVLVYNEPEPLKEWKQLAPALPVMPSLPAAYRKPGGVAEFEASCPAEALDGHVREWARELVDQVHAARVKVYVDILGSTDNAEGYAGALALGVDGIQTDYPDRLTRFLREQHHSGRARPFSTPPVR